MFNKLECLMPFRSLASTAFVSHAGTLGIRSALALNLVNSDGSGALGLYARQPTAFDTIDRAERVILASAAGLAISVSRSHADEDRRSHHLRSALINREMTGPAQGILLERERITPDQAFDVLRRASQHLNRKPEIVAQDLVDSVEAPETGSSCSP